MTAMAQKSFPGYDQLNPEIKKLMQRIDSLGIESELLFNRDAKRAIRYRAEPMLYVETDDTIKQEGMKRIVDTNGKEHFVGDGILKPMEKKQADAIRKNWRDNRLAHEAIMKTIKYLAPESEMTNHYEVHKNGMDTIDVSMMLSKEKNEYLEYGLSSFSSRSEIYNTLRAFPLFEYNCILNDDAKAYKFIDAEDFMTKAKAIFEKSNVWSWHKAVYEHDRGYKPETNDLFALRINHLDGDAPYDSRTEATIYKIANRQNIADKILKQLIDLIWQYTDKHKDVRYYEFQPFAKFKESSVSEIIQFASASNSKGAVPQNFHIVVYKESDKDACYFAFFKTDGDLWLPFDWTTVEHSKHTNKATAGNIIGKWNCSDQTLRNLGLDYDKMSGKIELKADGTFVASINGKGAAGHLFPHRSVVVKLHGQYKVKGDVISLNLKRKNISCDIEGPDNPKLDPDYFEKVERTTWDRADREYEVERGRISMQEEFMKDDILRNWSVNATFTFIDLKTVQIGSTIYLTR